jgi:hypothetical protein
MRHTTSLAFSSWLLALAAGLCFSNTASHAATIGTENTLVVLRVGDGSAALAGTAAPVFLEEYQVHFNGSGVPVSATHVQTITVPTTGALGTHLTQGGTAAVEGSLDFSDNGQYMIFAGYDSAVGATTQGAPRKIVGRLDLAGNLSFDAVYGPGTQQANSAMRTATSSTGNEYWFGMSGANAGTSYRPWAGPDTPGTLSTLLVGLNTRRLETFNGQLYVGTAAGSIHGVATVGTGLPTSGPQTATILPGMPTTAGPSPVDFWFADANTLYVADDRTFNSTTMTGNTNGGLQKWVYDSGTSMWNLVYTKNIDTTNDTIDYGLRGLVGGTVGSDGTVTLFGTTTFGTASTANFLVGMTDTIANTSAANVTVNTLASAALPGNVAGSTNFRGVEVIGVLIPEPGAFGMLAIGSLVMLTGRRRA